MKLKLLEVEKTEDGVDWQVVVLEDGELCVCLSSGEELRLPQRVAVGIANTILDAVAATRAADPTCDICCGSDDEHDPDMPCGRLWEAGKRP